ncbi:MAG: response regulator [Terriglobia bacterium]|jgi:signal transduction histidine kinase
MGDVASRADHILNRRTKSEGLVGLMPHKGLRIRSLVVEDNPTDAMLLKHTLKGIPDANFITTCVERLADAMSRLAATTFDIVLLDLCLPDSAGPETLTRLRQFQPEVPVVVLTGLDDEGVGISAVQMGAQDYLIKGRFPASLLGRSIRYAIERKRAEQSVMAQIRESAIVGERSRIAGEIHDILAQDFVGILLQLEAAREFNGLSPKETAKCIELAEAVARSGLAEARRSVWTLCPPELDADGLVGAVQGFLSRVAAGNPNVVAFSVRGQPYPLPNDTALGLLRICQEAVVNALRHAGANRIRVQITYQPSAVELCVEDNGRGFDPQASASSSGFGLTSMRQRAERIGGEINISAGPGQGTRLSVVAPAPLCN